MRDDKLPPVLTWRQIAALFVAIATLVVTLDYAHEFHDEPKRDSKSACEKGVKSDDTPTRIGREAGEASSLSRREAA